MRNSCWNWLGILFGAVQVLGAPQAGNGQTSLDQPVRQAMRHASEYFRNHLAAHGGYVYHYSLDLEKRWGEGEATRDQIWVQPPGTPTVGTAFLRAYSATQDAYYLDAATEAGRALIYGQLKSGGWTNCVDFDPRGERVAAYRNGKGQGKNNSSLDDGQTQSAIQFLVELDRQLEFQQPAIHDATRIALDALLAAQYPNGGFPQVWTQAVVAQPILPASYPRYDWRSEGRVKNYWEMYTINDNVTGYLCDTLIAAHEVYGDPRYLAALRKLGEFLILSQMPQPQRAWAQQYSYDMHPIWARKFEPPGVSGDETQEIVQTLLEIARVTGDDKFLKPIPDALNWLEQSLLPDGQVARYYELETNQALYMRRRGDEYTLTYDDSDLPSHYGWKTQSLLPQLKAAYESARSGATRTGDVPSVPDLDESVRRTLADLDSQGRWVSRYDGERLVGQPKMQLGELYLSSQTFSENLTLLSQFLAANPPDAPAKRKR